MTKKEKQIDSGNNTITEISESNDKLVMNISI